MHNELLDLIDQIEMESAIAEMEVCTALLNSYSKSCMILENSSETADLSSYSVFQESFEIYQEGEKWSKIKAAGSAALKDAKGEENEKLIIKILKFLPRLIKSFIRNLRANKKKIENKIDEVEKTAEKITEAVEQGDGKGNHLVISTNDVKWVDKDGNEKTVDDKEVRESQEKRTLALPMNDNGSKDVGYLKYANGDVWVKFPWNVFDLVTKLNKETVDFATILCPTEDALEMLVDTFSEDRLDEKGKPDYDQHRNRDYVVDNVRTRDVSDLTERIASKVVEAHKHLKNLDRFFTENDKEIEYTDIKDVMLSEVIIAYRNATGWMGYTEKLLTSIGNRISKTSKNLPTLKVGSAHRPDSTDDRATYLTTKHHTKITRCVRMLSRIVEVTNRRFSYIMKRCDDGLDVVYVNIMVFASRANIRLNTKMVSRIGKRDIRSGETIPHQYSYLQFNASKEAGGNRPYEKMIARK